MRSVSSDASIKTAQDTAPAVITLITESLEFFTNTRYTFVAFPSLFPLLLLSQPLRERELREATAEGTHVDSFMENSAAVRSLFPSPQTSRFLHFTVYYLEVSVRCMH